MCVYIYIYMYIYMRRIRELQKRDLLQFFLFGKQPSKLTPCPSPKPSKQTSKNKSSNLPQTLLELDP